MENTFGIASSIPVLRMLDEAAARAFYLQFLGYEVEWEHRFNDDAASPLYLQIRLFDSVLHLNGHAGAEDPVSEVRVSVRDLQGLVQYLRERAPDADIEAVDPRFSGTKTDLNLIDPSGNLIVFWCPLRSDDSAAQPDIG